MKKSEIDKLHELMSNFVVRATYQAAVETINNISEWLETIEVDPEPIEEVRPGLYVAKESTSILVDKRLLLAERMEKFGASKPKRKWRKWSELKDKFFTKKQQKEMKEQAEKELEEDDRP